MPCESQPCEEPWGSPDTGSAWALGQELPATAQVRAVRGCNTVEQG